MFVGGKEEGEAEGKVKTGEHEEAIVGGQVKNDGLVGTGNARQKEMDSGYVLEVDLLGLEGLHAWSERKGIQDDSEALP